MTTPIPVIYNRKPFLSIIEFDCRIIHLNTICGGTFFTVLAISNKDYREAHPMTDRAKVVINKDQIYTHFNITDDWGDLFTLSIPNYMNEYIDTAILKANEMGLIKLPDKHANTRNLRNSA